MDFWEPTRFFLGDFVTMHHRLGGSSNFSVQGCRRRVVDTFSELFLFAPEGNVGGHLSWAWYTLTCTFLFHKAFRGKAWDLRLRWGASGYDNIERELKKLTDYNKAGLGARPAHNQVNLEEVPKSALKKGTQNLRF